MSALGVASAIVAGIATVFVPYVLLNVHYRRKFKRAWRADGEAEGEPG